MWLLSTQAMLLELHHFNSVDEVPGGYAILSHVWQLPEQSFQDILQLQLECARRDDPRISSKIRKAIHVARSLGFSWVWIDTCCIDKTSSAELEEAINSMFRWYARAQMCFAYLADVPSDRPVEKPRSAFRRSRWFTRGWTLQELIAPQFLVFLASDWTPLGTKTALCSLVEEITNIDAAVLTFRRPLQQVSVASRISWASSRKTSRVEDEAYSLMGLFDVTMPTIYGEGQKAFQRLQEEIMKRTPDHTLFAWGRAMPASTPAMPFGHRRDSTSSLFAPSPSVFRDSADITPTDLGALPGLVSGQFAVAGFGPQITCEHRVTSYGIRCDFVLVEGNPFTLALLPCKTQAGECIALILWRRPQSANDFTQHFVGVAPYETPEHPGYRLLFIGPRTTELLRRIGWNSTGTSEIPPSAPLDHTRQGRSSSDVPEVRSGTATPTAVASGSLSTVYIANFQATPEPHTSAQFFPTEAHSFFISPWLAPSLSAHFGFTLQVKGGPLSGPAHPPQSYRFLHRTTHERFVLHLGRCSESLLCAHVSIRPGSPQDHTQTYADGVPYRPDGSPLPAPCPGNDGNDPAFPAVYHVNSWPNGSMSFGDARRTVHLTATRWPGSSSSYCLEVRLEGSVYEGLRERQRSRLQAKAGAKGPVPRRPDSFQPSGEAQSQAQTSSALVRAAAAERYRIIHDGRTVVFPGPDMLSSSALSSSTFSSSAFSSNPFAHPQWATAAAATPLFRSLQIQVQVQSRVAPGLPEVQRTPFASIQLPVGSRHSSILAFAFAFSRGQVPPVSGSGESRFNEVESANALSVPNAPPELDL